MHIFQVFGYNCNKIHFFTKNPCNIKQNRLQYSLVNFKNNFFIFLEDKNYGS